MDDEAKDTDTDSESTQDNKPRVKRPRRLMPGSYPHARQNVIAKSAVEGATKGDAMLLGNAEGNARPTQETSVPHSILKRKRVDDEDEDTDTDSESTQDNKPRVKRPRRLMPGSYPLMPLRPTPEPPVMQINETQSSASAAAVAMPQAQNKTSLSKLTAIPRCVPPLKKRMDPELFPRVFAMYSSTFSIAIGETVLTISLLGNVQLVVPIGLPVITLRTSSIHRGHGANACADACAVTTKTPLRSRVRSNYAGKRTKNQACPVRARSSCCSTPTHTICQISSCKQRKSMQPAMRAERGSEQPAHLTEYSHKRSWEEDERFSLLTSASTFDSCPLAGHMLIPGIRSLLPAATFVRSHGVGAGKRDSDTYMPTSA